MREFVLPAGIVGLVGLAALTGGCCSIHPVRDRPEAEEPGRAVSECPELDETMVRSIGYAAVRKKDPKLPPTPASNIRVTRYECNYLYTEIFAPGVIGGDVTVVIAPDGRVLDVLGSL